MNILARTIIVPSFLRRQVVHKVKPPPPQVSAASGPCFQEFYRIIEPFVLCRRGLQSIKFIAWAGGEKNLVVVRCLFVSVPTDAQATTRVASVNGRQRLSHHRVSETTNATDRSHGAAAQM